MGAANYLTGIQASVQVGATTFRFNKWGLKYKTKAIPASNFNSNGRQEVAKGITTAELTLEQQSYDQGNTAFATGNTYAFQLFTSATQSFTISFFVEEIDIDVDYENNQAIKITGTSNDTSFTAAIT